MTRAEKKAIKAEARALRAVIYAEEEKAILADAKNVLARATKVAVSRRYSEISEAVGCEIIWGKGGAQTMKESKLKALGKAFVKIWV